MSGQYDSAPTRLLCDNQSAMAIASNAAHHRRSKHIAVRYHHLRDHISKGDVTFIFVRSELQLADILTKFVTPLAKFESQVKALMCIDAPLNLESGHSA